MKFVIPGLAKTQHTGSPIESLLFEFFGSVVPQANVVECDPLVQAHVLPQANCFREIWKFTTLAQPVVLHIVIDNIYATCDTVNLELFVYLGIL